MIIVTFSCSKSDDCLSFEKTITINFGETKSICDNLEISFISVVNESRCPDNVQCVWAGELEVELSLIEELDQVSLLTLRLLRGSLIKRRKRLCSVSTPRLAGVISRLYLSRRLPRVI